MLPANDQKHLAMQQKTNKINNNNNNYYNYYNYYYYYYDKQIQ